MNRTALGLKATLVGMRKRRLLVVTILFPSALVLTACTGTSAESPTSAAPTSAAPSSSPTPSPSTPSTASSKTSTGAPATSSAVPAPEDMAAPTCVPGVTLIEQNQGPYYTLGAPERIDITAGAPGTPLLLTGYVLDDQCNPVAGATLDFWQADGNGSYDNNGYVLRGVQTTDENGAYALTTVIPGQYPGRTEHVHVKVTAPGGPTYTTQLYFPESTANGGDRFYVPGLDVTITSYDGSEMTAQFDMVLPA